MCAARNAQDKLLSMIDYQSTGNQKQRSDDVHEPAFCNTMRLLLILLLIGTL